MKYDTSKTGWESILKDYAADLLEKFIQEYTTSRDLYEIGSGDAWRYETKQLEKQDRTISRASIIFELNKMVDMDPPLMTWKDRTGKGGHHRIYRLIKSPHELEVDVVTHLLQRIKENWPKAYDEVIQPSV